MPEQGHKYRVFVGELTVHRLWQDSLFNQLADALHREAGQVCKFSCGHKIKVWFSVCEEVDFEILVT